MDKIKNVLETFFQSVKVSLESFVLPTGKYLIPSFIIAFGILIVVIVSKIFDWPVLLDWPGAALGVLVLGGILFIERSERSEVSNFYRTARKSVENIVGRQKKSSADETIESDTADIPASGEGDASGADVLTGDAVGSESDAGSTIPVTGDSNDTGEGSDDTGSTK